MGSSVDTVVLMYFLLVEEWPLLSALLEQPVLVPSIVFGMQGEDGLSSPSELTESARHYENKAGNPTTTGPDRQHFQNAAARLRGFSAAVIAGEAQIVNLSDDEWKLASHIQLGHIDRTGFRLGPGEVACLALAISRDLILVTDDSQALQALEAHAPGHPYERIRKLLRRAAQEQQISRERANELHDEMRAFGFWDRTQPFPDGAT